jgi:hypothetical protein
VRRYLLAALAIVVAIPVGTAFMLAGEWLLGFVMP